MITISFSKVAFADVTTLYGLPCSVHCPSSEPSKALRQLGCIQCMHGHGHATGCNKHATGSVGMQQGVVDMQVRSQFRKIFVAMGFEEMMTNAYVENRCALGKEPLIYCDIVLFGLQHSDCLGCS